MRSVLKRVRTLSYPVAGLLLAIAAVLALAVGTRAGLVVLALGLAMLAFALWLTSRTMVDAVARQRDALIALERTFVRDGVDNEIPKRLDLLDDRLRDMPVVAQQSTILAESFHRVENLLQGLRSENGTHADTTESGTTQ